MPLSETTPGAASWGRPTQETEATEGSAPQTNRGKVNYRIFRTHYGWMSYRYLVDPTQSQPSVQNRASSDSRRKDLRGVELLKSTMADSRVSRVLRSGRLLPHNAAPD